MNKRIITILLGTLLAVSYRPAISQESSSGVKTTLEMTFNKVGSVTCELNNKYNAAYWDHFMKTVGNNTSIIMNQMKKSFPKYHLSDFNYSQDVNERSNKIVFRMDGAININKDGKWEAELDQKNPDITRLTDKDFLLIDEGNTLKIHLPPGTHDAKVEKNSLGKARLTFSPAGGNGSRNFMLYAGLLIAVAGGGLMYKNRQEKK